MSVRNADVPRGKHLQAERLTRRRFLSILGAGTAGLALAACGGEQEKGSLAAGGDGPKAGGNLRIALFFDPDNLDPAAGGFGFPIFQKLYSYLHHVDGTDLSYMPDLSLEAPELPDDLTYIFNLQPGVCFQDVPPVDGREVNAEDVAYSLRRPESVFGVSDCDILCKQLLTDRDGVVLALRQRYVGPQQGESDDRAEVPGGVGGRGQQRGYEELRAAGEAGHPAQVYP